MQYSFPEIKVLSLNCQHGYRQELFSFLENILKVSNYDFLLFQEVDLKVWSWLEKNFENYKAVSSDYHDNDHAQTLVLYRNNWKLEDGDTHEFGSHFGLTTGLFLREEQKICVASIHADYFLRSKRAAQVQLAKKLFLEKETEADYLIFGGDFNSAWPGEVKSNDAILNPEFSNTTSAIPFTCESRYIESGSWFTNLLLFLARFGFNIKLKTDHIYLYARFEATIKAETLPVRVSDHSPVKVSIIKI